MVHRGDVEFMSFYDVTALIYVGYFCFLFIMLGPLNKKVRGASTSIVQDEDAHVRLQEEDDGL